MLTEVWSSHIKLQKEWVVFTKILLRLEKVDPVEPIVAPTFTHFELRLELSGYFAIGIALANHFDSIFILLSISRDTLLHLQKDWDVVTLRIVAIAIRVHFKSPSNPIRHQRLAVDRIFWMAMMWKVLQVIRCRHKLGNQIRSKLSCYIVHKLKRGSTVDFLQLSNQFCWLLY